MSRSRTVSIRLPPDLVEAIDDLARETDRSRTYLTKKALEAYLAEQADLQLALDRLRDPEDPVISSEQLRARVGRKRRV